MLSKAFNFSWVSPAVDLPPDELFVLCSHFRPEVDIFPEYYLTYIESGEIAKTWFTENGTPCEAPDFWAAIPPPPYEA